MTTDALGTLWLWTDTHSGHSTQEVFHDQSARTLAVPHSPFRVPQHRRLRVPERVDGDGEGEEQGSAVLPRRDAGEPVHAPRGGARVPHHVVRTSHPHGAPRHGGRAEGQAGDQDHLAGPALPLCLHRGRAPPRADLDWSTLSVDQP